MKPSRETEKEAAMQAASGGHIDILKYFVEERKISDEVKSRLRVQALQGLANSIASNT